MAGRGSRFTSNNVHVPKPLINIGGKYMIEWALKNVTDLNYSEIIFIILKEHNVDFQLGTRLRELNIPNSNILEIDNVTEGQLQTVLAAKDVLKTEEYLLISPTDTYVLSNIKTSIENPHPECSGIISVNNKEGNQWSFAKIDRFFFA